MCLATPGQIESIQDNGPLQRQGKVRFGGICKEVSLALVPEAQVGDYVLAHAGLAIGIVDAEEAAKVFEYLRELGDLEELEGTAP
ncbi:MAG: HypC/HybG/HupF family hydrogenase formation chaperone [Candidatus Hydrogenedentes bacterium]|nr:HypC/HybG/HupF family hydrogenase formation chaperone [Candidatus Hydrogenedentota bacterium]